MTAGPPAPRRGTDPASGEPPLRTLFFGSGDFAVPILGGLRGIPGVEVVAVVTTPDRPAGRHGHLAATPVAQAAAAAGLPLLQPASLRTPVAVRAIDATRPDLAVLADYGRIVPPDILALPRLGFLNLHPSLLPRHRGATPISGAILAGDTETGVTLFQMDAGTDTGPILDQVSWPLAHGVTSEDVEADAAGHAAALLASSLPRWLSGDLRPRPQEERLASLTRPFGRGDGRLDPAGPATALERRVRALQPWPGTFIETPAGRIAVLRAEVAASQPGDVPGRLVAQDDGLALATSDGRLVLCEVHPAGGRAMTGAALRRGRRELVGSPA